ncbi:uncharacterized protein AB675_8301 [Cyphellophora attinorum]|uniref:Uncharacterized protein n=1 Tax=Cyphellophora attinorum TaxID=1664694 RepID=A0A0N1HF60_9EURO|nr:uncharacterized protein AB675_8301 [Phialophora attinorum]KPI44292.1 hypothetical protein AB675_8301 [Phialophora attinorum]
MAVEQHGRRLLAECQEESLEDLLRNLRLQLQPDSKDVLGVKAIDQIFEVFRANKASPLRVPLDQTFDDTHDDIGSYEEGSAESVITQRPPVLEITSSSSAAGKTTLLYYLTAKGLLSAEHGGKASIVVWFDTDGRFSATRLHHVMNQLARKISSSTTEANISKALQHLYLFRPATSSQLLEQLTNLPTPLLDHGSSSTRPLGLLILDSATAFRHQDRFDAELTRLEAGADYAIRPKSPTKTSSIIAALNAVQSRFECAVVFSTQQHTPSSGSPNAYQPEAPARAPQPANRAPDPQPPADTSPVSPWTTFATLSLTTARLAVSRFAPAMSLEECLRDRDKRAEAVAQGKFSIGVDWSQGDRWPAGVRDGVSRVEAKGRVGMVIRGCDEGVGVRDDVVVEIGGKYGQVEYIDQTNTTTGLHRPNATDRHDGARTSTRMSTQPLFPVYPDLKGKTALLMGIGQTKIPNSTTWGNGAAIARGLAHNGVRIFGCDINLAAAEHTAQRLREEFGNDCLVEVTTADVTVEADVQRVVQ